MHPDPPRRPSRRTSSAGARRSLVALAGPVALAAALAGCSTGASAAASTSTTTTAAPTTTTTTFPPQYVTINGKRIKVPTEGGDQAPITTLRTEGNQIIIAHNAALPLDLDARLTGPVVWTNLTTKPVRVIMLHYPAYKQSPVIAPGKSFSLRFPMPTSVGYRISTGQHGVIDMGDWPGA